MFVVVIVCGVIGEGCVSVWSSGMIPPLGGGGPGFDSPNGPLLSYICHMVFVPVQRNELITWRPHHGNRRGSLLRHASIHPSTWVLSNKDLLTRNKPFWQFLDRKGLGSINYLPTRKESIHIDILFSMYYTNDTLFLLAHSNENCSFTVHLCPLWDPINHQPDVTQLYFRLF